jgi:hypothetical protein
MATGNADPGYGAERDDMGDHRQIDRIRAERLLDGTDRGTDSVGRLLAAARGPVRPDELRREAEAIGAFRVGATPATPRRLVTAPHRTAPHRTAPQRVASHRRAWTKLVGVKVAALAFAVTLAGVALAAGTGVLPNPLDGPPAPTSALPPTPPVSPLSSDTRSPSSSSTSASGASSPGASASPGAAANHASLVGLCRAYQARGDRDPSAALGSTAFAGLVAAAGGADRVEAFCADLLAAEPAPGNGGTTPTAEPSPSASGSNGQSDGQGNGNAQSSGQTSGQSAGQSSGTLLGTGAAAGTPEELSGA